LHPTVHAVVKPPAPAGVGVAVLIARLYFVNAGVSLPGANVIVCAFSSDDNIANAKNIENIWSFLFISTNNLVW
jgi:branched-subunit amino acid permease